MKSYEEMSDFEINKLVALSLFSGPFIETHQIGTNSAVEICDKTGEIDTCDYCNNPSDAWPIILDNGISINKWDKSDKFWTADVEHPKACDEYNTIEIKHENPLRAAMICFLKMKDAENGI